MSDDNLDGLKAMLPLYLERYYGERIKRKTAGRVEMRCPFHDDRNPSFSADNSKGTWLFRCFSCDTSGSILDLHAQAHGATANSKENIESTANAVGYHLPDMPELTDKEKRRYAIEAKKRAKAVRQVEARAKQQARVTEYLKDELYAKLEPFTSKHWKSDLMDASPLLMYEPDAAPHDFLLSLYHADDILWMGDVYDTGKAEHTANFRTRDQWLELEILPPRIGSGTFQQGGFSRSLDNVTSSPYIILESDDLIGRKPTTPEEREANKALSYALIGYAVQRLGLTLRSVIDTGGKSLHAWFDRPPPDELKAVEQLADGLRIDSRLLTTCQASPLRMPHCMHDKTNTRAQLLFLKPIHF